MTDSTAPRVVLDLVSFRYDQTIILDGISVTFESGVVNYLVGASGAGKTTLAMLLAGVLESDSGTIELSPNTAPRLVLQFPELLFLADSIADEWAIVKEQVLRDRAEWAMLRFGLSLETLKHRSPRTLSFGQRRLLALALQSAHDSQFLILDEPSLGLDEVHLAMIVAWIRELVSERRFCLVITHDSQLLERCPGRVFILQKGSIEWAGESQDFLRRSELQHTAGFR